MQLIRICLCGCFYQWEFTIWSACAKHPRHPHIPQKWRRPLGDAIEFYSVRGASTGRAPLLRDALEELSRIGNLKQALATKDGQIHHLVHR